MEAESVTGENQLVYQALTEGMQRHKGVGAADRAVFVETNLRDAS